MYIVMYFSAMFVLVKIVQLCFYHNFTDTFAWWTGFFFESKLMSAGQLQRNVKQLKEDPFLIATDKAAGMCSNTFQEYSRNKMQGSLLALQQFQQKSSPLSSFNLGGRQIARKPTLFESRFCKELMAQNFDKVMLLFRRHVFAKILMKQKCERNTCETWWNK